MIANVPLYALVEDYYQDLAQVYDDRYQQQYGRWRPVIGKVLRKYLECGDLHRGFARLACRGCRYQAILSEKPNYYQPILLSERKPKLLSTTINFTAAKSMALFQVAAHPAS